MNPVEITNHYIRQASELMGLGSQVERLLLSAEAEHHVTVPIELDNGDVAVFSGQAFSAAVERGEPWAARLLTVASELAARFVDVRTDLTRLDVDGPTHKPAELEQLRTRLLAEWDF